MLDQQTPIPLIFDDDGSQDGMTALAYMLANPDFEIEAITIAQGIARPEVFVENLARMLKRVDAPEIPIGVGRPDPLEGDNAFPEFIREGSDTFWAPFVTIPELEPEDLPIETSDAAQLIVDTVNNSPEPVAILATGTMTNIAEALRLDPDIIDNISVVQILGGAVFVPGNLPVLPDPPFSTNLVAEFNIWVDPVAAQEVFDAGDRGLKIQLVPLDATNPIEFFRSDLEAWLATGTPESEIAAEFLDFALTVIASENDPNPVWDLVAAINLSEPDFSQEVPLRIEVDTESDPSTTQGQTQVVEGEPNVLVTLDASFDNIAYDTSEVFLLNELDAPDTVFGSLGNDTFDAETGSGGLGGSVNLTFAGAGADAIDTSASFFGRNRVFAGSGDDELFAGISDRLSGGTGDDILDATANRGDNRLAGGEGNDDFFAGRDDRYLGEEGSDRFFVLSGGNNAFTGGTGADEFWIANAQFPEAANIVTDFAPDEDVLGIAGLNASFEQLTLDGETVSLNGQPLAILTAIDAAELASTSFVFA